MSETPKTIIAPLVHMNGTSKDVLQCDLMNAARKIREAQDALRETCPNARDYYPLKEPGAFQRARDEYWVRQEHLQLVYNELLALFEAIDQRQTEAAPMPPNARQG